MLVIEIILRVSILGQLLLVKTALYISTMTVKITLFSLGGVLLLELMRKHRNSRYFLLIMLAKYILDIYTGLLICDLAGWEYWVAIIWTLIDAILVDRVGGVYFYLHQTKCEKEVAKLGNCVWLRAKNKLSVISIMPIWYSI